MLEVEARRQLRDERRAKFNAECAEEYAQGLSIRQIAALKGYSYGKVRGALVTSGVTLRGVGGQLKKDK